MSKRMNYGNNESEWLVMNAIWERRETAKKMNKFMIFIYFCKDDDDEMAHRETKKTDSEKRYW